MEIATTTLAEVILRMRLPFSTDSRGADRERAPEHERLLHRRRPLRAATAQRAVNAIDMRRARMTANIAKPFFHRTVSFSRFVPEIVREERVGRNELFNRWSCAPSGFKFSGKKLTAFSSA
jgi:hypothetical protein